MPRPASLGGDLDEALEDDSKDLMILHGSAATTAAAKIYAIAAALDPYLRRAIQFDTLAVLTKAEKDKWFPGGVTGFCVLNPVDREPFSSGPLEKLLKNNEPSEDLIRRAFNGTLP